MKPMSVVSTKRFLARFAFLVCALNIQTGCSLASDNGAAESSFSCDRHSPEEVMTGLAKFKGNPGAGGVDRAIEGYREAAASNEISQAEANYCIGRLLFDSGEHHRAERFFSESIDSEPSAHEAYFERAVLRSRLGRCSEAISGFEVVAEMIGTSFDLGVEAARAYYDCDRLQEALDAANAAARALPSRELTFELLLIKAKILTGIGRYDEALRYASEAVERMRGNRSCDRDAGLCTAPDLVEAVNVLSNLHCSRGEIDSANQLYQLYQHYSYPAPEMPSCLESSRTKTHKE